MGLILLIVLILLLIGAVPSWPYSRNWGLLAQRRSRARRADRFDPAAPGKDLGRKLIS
jgi:Protein of unknown function (DUF3309)